MDELSFDGRFALLRQGDAAQIARDDAQAQLPFPPVLPVIGIFAPAEIPSQTRNVALNAHAPADSHESFSECAQCLSFLRELACGRDDDQFDTGSGETLLDVR